jgi:hypothetical protein
VKPISSASWKRTSCRRHGSERAWPAAGRRLYRLRPVDREREQRGRNGDAKERDQPPAHRDGQPQAPAREILHACAPVRRHGDHKGGEPNPEDPSENAVERQIERQDLRLDQGWDEHHRGIAANSDEQEGGDGMTSYSVLRGSLHRRPDCPG